MDSKLKDIRLIVGLGNPGSRYANTYHNVGETFVRIITKGLEWENPHQLLEIANLPRSLNKVRYLIPATFMNSSGEAVGVAIKRYKLSPQEILIVHDDSDLKLGSYKISLGRGSGGHNGVQSVINVLKTKDFYRLRIGVRTKIGKASDFVLSRISKEEKQTLEKVYEEIKETIIEKEWVPV